MNSHSGTGNKHQVRKRDAFKSHMHIQLPEEKRKELTCAYGNRLSWTILRSPNLNSRRWWWWWRSPTTTVSRKQTPTPDPSPDQKLTPQPKPSGRMIVISQSPLTLVASVTSNTLLWTDPQQWIHNAYTQSLCS
jgi:hypothetical protein